jgi:Fe-Mn family superoxide dismutase
LNKALEADPKWLGKPIEDVLSNIGSIPESARQAVINNGGGHANHTMFWQIMGPGKGGAPTGSVAAGIKSAFGGFDAFKERFSTAAATRFGSGWAWLVVGKTGHLEVLSTANQDSPIMQGMSPILGIDVWEHAYYLKYQNRRPDYVAAWWNTVNWEKVEELYAKARR